MSIQHCAATIARIVAEDRADPRSILQLGYNLGRLSELTGLGREPFWDRWKDAATNWDQPALRNLVRELLCLPQTFPQDSASRGPTKSAPSEETSRDFH
jgi:hypothetical protein